MIGDILTINSTNLLVLDEIDGNPFVICLDTGISTKFDDDSNNYKGSILNQKVNNWIANKGFKTIPRTIDLTAMDGYKGYGSLTADAAPLTFDEYRKYADVLIPHVENWFWTATAWGSPDRDTWASNRVCYVYSDGSPDASYYSATYGRLAPAFILDKNSIKEKQVTLADFTTAELLAEIAKRAK